MTKVLVADDNETNRYLLEAMLSGGQFDVKCVSNGALALEQAHREKPDIIVADILMPEMDGFALCKQWRESPDLREVPFVFYTATYTDPKDEEFALSLGADAFILKPQEPEVFVEKLESLLKGHSGSRRSILGEPPVSEEVFLRGYNQSLIRKLEDKLVQLEQANKRLQSELYARHEAEREVRRLNAELENRVEARTRELAAANRELAEFSHSVSHDLRAPLRHITGFISLLMEDGEAAFETKTWSTLKIIKGAAARMDQLIDGLLSLAQNEARSFNPQCLSMETVVENCRQVLLPGTRDRDVTWQVRTLPDAIADEALVRQVWMNLMDNALKYSRHQSRAVIEISGREDRQRGEIEYSVRDNGVGFEMAYASKLFDVFQRLHNETQFEGIGLGLATARKIVERHGGRIWAESKPGIGTTFFFTVPTSVVVNPGHEVGGRSI